MSRDEVSFFCFSMRFFLVSSSFFFIFPIILIFSLSSFLSFFDSFACSSLSTFSSLLFILFFNSVTRSVAECSFRYVFIVPPFLLFLFLLSSLLSPSLPGFSSSLVVTGVLHLDVTPPVLLFCCSYVLMFSCSRVFMFSCSHVLMFPCVTVTPCSHVLMFPCSHVLMFSWLP